MLAKWVVAVFLGLFAVFAGDLRADTHPTAQAAVSREEQEFLKLLDSNLLTGSMREHLISIHDHLGTPVRISEWELKDKEYAPKIERALRELDGPEFFAAVPAVAAECRIPIKNLEIGTIRMHTSETFYVDFTDSHMVASVAKLPEQCDGVRALVKEMSALAAPRAVVADMEDVIVGHVTISNAKGFLYALKETKFLAAIDEYDRECRLQVKSIKLNNYDTYSSSDKQRSVDLGRGAAELAARLSGTAEACNEALPLIAEINGKVSIEHGVMFHLDAEDFFRKDITVAEVKSWARALVGSPKRVESLRKAILASAKPQDFDKLRACLADSSKAEADCNKILMAVRMGPYSDINNGTFAYIVVALLGDPFITGTAILADQVINGPMVTVDITKSPKLPPKFR